MHPPQITYPLKIKSTSNSLRLVLVVGLILSLIFGVFLPFEFWERAYQFKSNNDLIRFYGNIILSIGFFALFFFMGISSLHLLLKKIELTEKGVYFSGLVNRSFRWGDVKSMELFTGDHTNSLLITTLYDEKYEIGIGDKKAGVVCLKILKTYKLNGKSR